MQESSSKSGKPIAGIVLALLAVGVIVGVTIYNKRSQGGAQKGDDEAAALTIGFDEAPRSSDPRLIGFDANGQYLEELRFLPLFSFNEDGSLRPMLAESIQPNGDKSFVVKIRTGLTFANGNAITPHDVVATYKHMLFPPGNFPPSPRKGAFSRVQSIFKTSPDEVTFTLKEPDAAFPTNLVIGILPESAKTEAPEQLEGKGYESGPYVLKKRTTDLWLLARNDKFNGPALGMPMPHLSPVKILAIKDETTRYAALMRGDLDILQNGLDADKVVSAQRNTDFKVLTKSRMGIDYLGFATDKGVMKDPKVRLAIAHAINRDEILKYTLQDLGIKATGTFPPESSWSTELPQIEYDPEKAKSLLDEASLPVLADKGNRFSFAIKISTNKTRIAVAKAIAAQLAKVGVAVEVESLEFGVFMNQLEEGAIACWLGSWTGFKDGDHLHFAFNSRMAPPAGGNRGRYSNARVDELTALAKANPDTKQRKEYYDEVQKIISAELPYVFLWHPKSVAIVKANIDGFRMYSDGRYLSLPDVQRK